MYCKRKEDFSLIRNYLFFICFFWSTHLSAQLLRFLEVKSYHKTTQLIRDSDDTPDHDSTCTFPLTSRCPPYSINLTVRVSFTQHMPHTGDFAGPMVYSRSLKWKWWDNSYLYWVLNSEKLYESSVRGPSNFFSSFSSPITSGKSKNRCQM